MAPAARFLERYLTEAETENYKSILQEYVQERAKQPPEYVPLKMTSCILVPRSVFADCSPSTQRTASATLLFPHPLGPTSSRCA